MDHIDAYSTLRNTKLSYTARLRIVICAAALIAIAFTTNSAWALHSCASSPSSISVCCVADLANGLYYVDSNLTSPGDCIKISAPHVTLYLNGNLIKGGGKGIGIHVLSTAGYSQIINLALPAQAVVDDFVTGVKVDAPHTLVAGVTADFDTKGMVFSGRAGFGLLIKADGNTKNGIILTPAASDSYLLDTEAQANFGNGIVLNQTTGVTLVAPLADSNKAYGLWLKGASYNSVIGAELEGNGIAGAYLGCESNFARPAGCGLPATAHNTLEGDGADNPIMVGSCPAGKQTNQPYGIVIDKGNGHNHVTNAYTEGNPKCANPADTLWDGYDGNGKRCKGNVWYTNWLLKKNHLAREFYSCMR